MATVKTYDQKCYDLAMEFLKDEGDLFSALHVHLLALEIQQCIEDEIWFMREKPELYPLLSKKKASLPAEFEFDRDGYGSGSDGW